MLHLWLQQGANPNALDWVHYRAGGILAREKKLFCPVFKTETNVSYSEYLKNAIEIKRNFSR